MLTITLYHLKEVESPEPSCQSRPMFHRSGPRGVHRGLHWEDAGEAVTRVTTADTRHVAELDGHVSGSGPYRAGPARAGAWRQVYFSFYITLSTFLNHLITEVVVARLQWTREVASFIRRSRYRTCWSWLLSWECGPRQYWTEKRVDYDIY